MRHYDDGGAVAPDQDSLVNQWLTQQMKQQPIGAPSAPPAVQAPPTPPPDLAGSGQGAAMSGSDGDTKIADSHPGVPQGTLDNYIQGQEKQVDKFGPDQQAAVMNMIAQQQGGWKENLGRRMTGLGDDLIQVSGKGNPGHLANYTERENQIAERAANQGKSLNEQQQTGLKEKQALEGMTSKSPLGSTEALATQLLAKKMFPELSPDQLTKLTQNPQALAKYFSSIAEYNKAMADIQNTAEFRDESLKNQRAQIQGNIAGREAETTQGSARALESRSFIQKLMDTIHPSQETKSLMRQISQSGQPQSFDSEQDAEAANLPAGTLITIGGRPARVK
jgi:hypothetical protein